MPQDITQDRVNSNSVARIRELDAVRLSRYRLKAGDIVYSRRGDVERRALISEREDGWLCGTGCLRVRFGEGVVHPRYAAYYLSHPASRKWVVRHAVGATMPNLNTSILGALPFLLPPLPEQRRIARILGALDDKIELNRRTNETLEAMARALFRAWFVDFEPVRAKQDGRPLDPLSQKHLHLFPDRLVETEHGEIPEGWEWGKLGELFEVNPPRRLPKGTVAPYLDMANMPIRGHRADEWILREVGSGAKFQNGDTLLARITPCLENGKTAFVDFLADGEVGWGSTEFIVLRPKPPLPPYFGYLLAREPEFRDFAIQAMNGSSGRQRVPPDSVKPWRIAAPRREVCEAFGDVVEPLARRIRSNATEAKTLAETRDALLPQLLSGEIRVPIEEVSPC